MVEHLVANEDVAGSSPVSRTILKVEILLKNSKLYYMSQYRICSITPCWGRPARTRRVINNILAQDINNWEAFVIGDGCPIFQGIISSGEAEFYRKVAESQGNKLHIFNLEKNYGGFGYHIINYAIKNNNSNYVVFIGNDDIVAPHHFSHYLSEIENTDLDMVGYNTCMTFLPLNHCIRPTSFQPGLIGHSEIIVKSATARMFEHTLTHGHDWEFIQNIYKLGKSKIAKSRNTTYFVTHTTVSSNDVIFLPFETID